MIKDMLGIIDVSLEQHDMQQLIGHRCVGALPISGRYRLIDFVLSNMVNSGMNSVAIFPKNYYRSLMDHLGSGKEWDLNRKRDGLFIFPFVEQEKKKNYPLGSFEAYRHHIDYFLRSTQRYTVISNSHTLCNIDFRKVLDFHIQEQSDITIVRHEGKSLDIYLLETSLLLDLISNYDSLGYETVTEVVYDLNHNLKVRDYDYDGFVATIDSIENYFKHSLDMINPFIWKNLFLKDRPIYTKVKDESPTKYTDHSQVKNSLVANGCVIEGTIDNSIISRSVKIGKGSVIKNCIIMQKSIIGENVMLDSVIIDKDVKVENGVKMVGSFNNPIVLPKGSIQGAMMKS